MCAVWPKRVRAHKMGGLRVGRDAPRVKPLCGDSEEAPSPPPPLRYMRKCPQCGGFFPWVSWKLFLTSAVSPGNGGVDTCG